MNSHTKGEFLSLAHMTQRVEELNRHWKGKRETLAKSFNRPQRMIVKSVFQDGVKRHLWIKGRKGGGTHAYLYPIVRIAGTRRNQAIYVIGPTHQLQKEILWENQRLQKAIPPSWEVQYKGGNDTRAVFKETDSFIKVWGANDWKTMAGIEGNAFVFDELADHDARAYRNCYPNIASRDAVWFALGAPPIEAVKSSFYYNLYQVVKKDPDWAVLQWSTWENAEFLPGGAEWIQNEKDKYYAAGQGDLWEQLWEAKFVIGGGKTVLSHFVPPSSENESILGVNKESQVIPHEILIERLSRDKHKLQWFAIFDPGYATCFAVLFACYNPYTAEVFLLDEIYETDRSRISVAQIWPQVKFIEKSLYESPNWRYIYDSAALGFPQEVRAQVGGDVHFQPTYKEKSDEDIWFRVINTAFYQRKHWVSDKCANFILEAQDYVTREDGTYPDARNHQLDNDRYLFKAINYKPLERAFDVLTGAPYSPRSELLKNNDASSKVLRYIDPILGDEVNDKWGFYD